ncbi:MAG: TRAP transporter small permease [Clostridiales Family XIII bacterium]|jgi:TRAP-type C4-dicarboxylate transport system permease small subunit|nr:TRAP transporter small permease [Clostridiales Family XIII bacterium]
MKSIIKTVDMIAQALNWVALLCFAGIMFFIVLDVLLRFVFNSPILGSFEIVERLMFCGVFCSFAFAQTTGTHIHITMILSKAPKRAGLVIFGLGNLLSTGICAVLCYAVIQQALLEAEKHYTTAILKIPTAPFYCVVIIAVIAFAIALLWSSCKCFFALFNKTAEEEVTSAWV